MKVYLAGPMRGHLDFNFPTFYLAEAMLGDNHEVYNPARVDADAGFAYAGRTGDEDLAELGFDVRAAQGAGLAWIAQEADAICLLDGWHTSRGAVAELAVAASLGLQAGTLRQMLRGKTYPATETLTLWRVVDFAKAS